MTKETLPPIQYTVVSPAESGRLMFEPRVVPVVPLDASQIINMDRIGRTELIKGTKLAYAQPYLERTFSHPLSEIRPETLILAATLVNLRTTEWDLQYTAQTRAGLKVAYETERHAIRRTSWGRSKQNAKIQETVALWKQVDNPLGEATNSTRSMKDALVDDFIDNLFFKRNGVKGFQDSIQDLQNWPAIDPNQISDLLNLARDRLLQLRGGEYSNLFRYKDGTQNIMEVDETRFLRQVVTTAFSDPQEDNPFSKQIKEVGKAMYEFYWRNVDNLFGRDEQTPDLTLTCEMVLAAVHTGNLDLIEKVVKDVWVRIGKQSNKFRKDYIRAIQLRRDELNNFKETFTAFEKADHEGPEKVAILIDTLNPLSEERRHIIGKYSDTVDNFNALSMFANQVLGLAKYAQGWQRGIDFGSREPDKEVDKRVVKSLLTGLIASRFRDTKSLLTTLTDFFPKDVLQESSSWEFDRISKADSNEKKQTLLSDYLDKGPDLFEQGIRDNWLAVVLFGDKMPTSYEEFKRLVRENKNIFHKIRYKNVWFVAPNGDQFHYNRNPELDKYSIETLTFYPDPEISGTRIQVKTKLKDNHGNPYVLNVSITGEGSFVNDDTKIRMPLQARLVLENLLLERLHFITSGALGEKGSEPKAEEAVSAEAEEEVVRRSHWRTLTSTPDRIYTLTSESAKHHAEYVKRVYGYDIYAENLRRRTEGELKPNEVITFVKAVEGKKEPNQLVYNPDLLAA